MQDLPEPEGSSPPPRRPSQRVTRQFVCVGCGYNIRGQAIDDLCPECGTPVMHSMGQPAPTSGWAVASLVLGILSVIGCLAYGIPGIIMGPLAIWFGVKAKRLAREGQAGGSTMGLATAGFVCGIVGTLLSLIGLAFIAFALILPMMAGQFP